ncbi:MAG: GntR family transcriptional regulator [Spirochaetales bacterium]|nr:GntR family transcriptional regulator [Spirochaetales bacterium]
MADILYLKIYRELKENILNGRFAPGEKLMGLRELAVHFHASHKTISRALDYLVQEGFIRVTQGQGIFIQEKSRWKNEPPPSGELGLILNDMSIPFNVRFSSILERRAADSGYRLIIRSSDYDRHRQEKDILDLPASGVQGLIVVPSPGDSSSEAFLKEVRIPVIYTGEFLPSLDFPGHYAVVDSYAGFYHAADMLASSGHEAIGYIGIGPDLEAEPGCQACRDVLASRKHPFDESFFVSAGGYDAEEGFKAMNELLLNEQYPTAVLCFSDTLAAGALKACRQADLRVPDDISLIGAGDQDIAQLVDPPLTTLRSPAELMGQLTIGLLDDLIRRRISDEITIRIRLDMELLQRGSVSAVEETEGNENSKSRWL